MAQSTTPTPIRVSIGIPAFNEAANIGRLLRQLVGQIEDGFILAEIIIASDGSTDTTGAEIKAVGDSRIKFNDYRSRRGKTARMNQLLTAFTGDVIILCDADITLGDNPRFIAEAIRGFKPEHGLLAVHAAPLPGHSFIERSLHAGMTVAERIGRMWNHGVNYLPYRGACLMLSSEYAKQIKLPTTLVTNDAYLFFYALQLGFTPQYRPDVYVYFQSPTNLADHVRQSQRFQFSGAELSEVLEDFDAAKQYRIPGGIMIKALLIELLRNPLHLLGYIAINRYTAKQSAARPDAAWEVATSTKKIGS